MSTPYPLQATNQAMTELRRRVRPEDVVLPVMSTMSLAPAGRVRLLGEGVEELVTYTGFGTDAVGMPTLTGCTRGANREQGGAAAREWPGGTYVVQAPYERPELVSALPAETVDQAGRQVYVASSSPKLSFYAEDDTSSALYDLTSPVRWPAARLGEFGGAGAGSGQFNGDVRGITVRDDTGHVYVSSDNRIQKFSAIGAYVSTVAASGSGNGQVNTPWGLEHVSGSLFVADSGNHRYQVFNSSDAYAAQAGTFGSGGSFTGQLNAPRDIGIHPVTLIRYVMDTGNHRIVAFTAANAAGGADGSQGSGLTQYETPSGLHIAFNRYWIADTNNHRLHILPFSGDRFVVGEQGPGAGRFDAPLGLDVDRHGNVYIADSVNHRVVVYDANGVFRGALGEYGTGQGQFDTPMAVTIGENYIYVADSGNRRVQYFSNPVAGLSFLVGEYEGTWAPADVAAGSVVITTISVPGALTSDYVEWSHTGSLTLTANMVIWAKVTSADNVTVFLINNAAATGRLTSGTLRLRVTR